MKGKLLIVAINQPGHMGSYFASAAKQLGLNYDVLDAASANSTSRIVQATATRLAGKPPYLERFARQVLTTASLLRPNLVLTTGFAPLKWRHIRDLQQMKAAVFNYSTDDPWNPKYQARWCLSTISSYDAVFTPRRANIHEFRACGVKTYYLPFACDLDIHRPWVGDVPTGKESDILFVGGCDEDRLPLICALIDAGFELALFGGYWERHSKTRPYWRGLADQDTIRAASACARICLCLVRRANRDGHTMRSFEAAAIGGCILAEDTADHRELYGPHDQAVRFFRTTDELVQQAKLLLRDSETRSRLAYQLRLRFGCGKNSYRDRLITMLQVADGLEPSS